MSSTETKNLSLQNFKYMPVRDEESHDISPKKSDTFFLYFSVLTGALLLFTGGTSMTWTSPVISKLQSNDSNVNPLIEPATVLEISLLTGLPGIPGLLGALLAPVLSDVLGRKRSLQMVGVGMFLSQLFVAFSNRIIFMTIGRCIFAGMFIIVMAVLPVFITELCENHNRAKFGCIFVMAVPMGNLYSYLVGPLFNVRIFTLLTIVPLIPFVLFCFTCESPVYLLSKDRKEECLKSLQRLRSNKSSKEILADFEEIENTLKLRQTRKQENILSLFQSKQGRVGLVLAFIPILLNFGSGMPILVAYLGPIFDEAEISISGNNSAIIVGIIKVCSFLVAYSFVEKIGRKPLLCISSASCGLLAIFVGIFFFLKQIKSPVVENIRLLPLIGIILFVIFYSLGMGSLPLTIVGELFNSEFRSAALAIVMTSMSIIGSLMIMGFPLLAEYLGLHFCFWFFSFNCIFGAICVYLFLPETKGKSIMEIQEIIRNYKFTVKKPA